MEKTFLEIDKKYPEERPLTREEKANLLEEITYILTSTETPGYIIKYCVDYLTRRGI